MWITSMFYAYLLTHTKEHNDVNRSDHGSNHGSERGSEHGSGTEGGDVWSDWDSMRASPPSIRIGIKMESGSPEVRSPKNWHEPRSSYNAYTRNSSYPSLAPILPSINSTTTMDRSRSSGSDALNYYQRSQQQMEDRPRQAEELDHHNPQQQILRDGHDMREHQRRW